MFKKKKLALGIVAGLAGALGIVTSAQAVHVNPDGTGQVLIFPYFNAHPGYVTNINLVNSTDKTKAVKIRFREGDRSNDVLDFNIYMSPQDVWTGSVRSFEDKDKNLIGSISTTDRTCTLPQLASCKDDKCEVTKEFTGHQIYTGVDAADTREGYVEVIEMGVVEDKTVQAGVLHKNGTPVNCNVVKDAWKSGGVFYPGGSGDTATGLSKPTGGLFGSSAVLNIPQGVAYAIDPVAIDNYSNVAQHYLSDDPDNFLLPSLASGNVNTSTITVQDGDGDNQLVTTIWKDDLLEDACLNDKDDLTPKCGTNPYPISHVLLASNVMNEYFLDPTNGYDGHTDWVMTFPMKKHGIHNADTDVSILVDGMYDREETSATATEDTDFGFSPVLPGKTKEEAELKREVNVVTFLTSDPSYDDKRTVFSSHSGQTLSVGSFVHGWTSISFPKYDISKGYVSSTAYGHSVTSANTNTLYPANSSIYQGVPVAGFAAIEGNVSSNAGARFGDALPHKINR